MRLVHIDIATATKLNEYSMDDFKTAAKAAGSRVKDAAIATAGHEIFGQGGEAAGRLASRKMADGMMQGWLQYKGSSGKPATSDNVLAFLRGTIQREFGKNVLNDAQLQALVSGTPANQVPASPPVQQQTQQQGQQLQQPLQQQQGQYQQPQQQNWSNGGGGGNYAPAQQQYAPPAQTGGGQPAPAPIVQPVSGGAGGKQNAPGRRPASSQTVQPVNPGPTGQVDVAPITYRQAQQQKANKAATASTVKPLTYQQSLQQQKGTNPTGQPDVKPTTWKQDQQRKANDAATASTVAPQKFSSQDAAAPAPGSGAAPPGDVPSTQVPPPDGNTNQTAGSRAGSPGVGTGNAKTKATHIYRSKYSDNPVTPTGKKYTHTDGSVYVEVRNDDGSISTVPGADTFPIGDKANGKQTSSNNPAR